MPRSSGDREPCVPARDAAGGRAYLDAGPKTPWTCTTGSDRSLVYPNARATRDISIQTRCAGTYSTAPHSVAWRCDRTVSCIPRRGARVPAALRGHRLGGGAFPESVRFAAFDSASRRACTSLRPMSDATCGKPGACARLRSVWSRRRPIDASAFVANSRRFARAPTIAVSTPRSVVDPKPSPGHATTVGGSSGLLQRYRPTGVRHRRRNCGATVLEG
jgi:hypothetical protein